MFGGKKEMPKLDSSEVSTLIGEGCVFEGNLNLTTATRIDGTIKGNVKSSGVLIIGESGSVEGDIDCSEVLIYGRVSGNVQAKRIEIKKGASLNGDINVDTFVVEEGALYNGTCSMKGLEISKPSPVTLE